MSDTNLSDYETLVGFKPEPRWIFAGLLAFALSIFIALFTQWTHIDLLGVSAQSVATLLFGLFVLALAIERVTEVAIQIFYGQAKRKLASQAKHLSAPIDAKIRALNAATPTNKSQFDAITKSIAEIQESLADELILNHKKKSNQLHRVCQRLALGVGASLGFVASLAGIRLLETMMGAVGFSTVSEAQRVVLEVTDIIVTAALLAGGSDGIHQIITAVGKIGQEKPTIDS